MEEAIAGAKRAMEGGEVEKMKSAQEQLLSSSHKLAEAMYKAAGAQQVQQPPTGGDGAGAKAEPPKDNVVDAEFVDVDEKKRGA